MTLSARAKFQVLLRDLFKIDCADLDFGIYRIMNYKRQVIEKWITEDLLRAISDEFESEALAKQTPVQDVPNCVDYLTVKQRRATAGGEYSEAQEKAGGARSGEALEAAVYNHLYTFFSHYWQDGDFIPKRRYSKKGHYAIPYNGEEVYLYWVNHDQYYVKTGEYFTDYTYKAPNGVSVHFKLQQAQVELNNVKDKKRFFLPLQDSIAWDELARRLIIPFEFRLLTEPENLIYGRKDQQKAIIAKAVEEIPKCVTAPEALAALTAIRRKTEKGESVTWLEYHLRRYTRRNVGDFFIHKDLRGFLLRELDFYLKNEVLNLDEMEAAGEKLAEGWFQLLRLIKRVGGHIIDFLAQIEDFQKMLWEKKKFVTETFYVITVGNIPEVFYPEIAACEAQWQEWRTLLAVETPKVAQKRVEFLKAHPTLPLDTRHFPQDPSTGSGQSFTDRLLASFDNLDDLTDGLLVHSENWQALNLLQEKYRERVKCIYIDPPYNTGASTFVYKNEYRHSSWMSMMLQVLAGDMHFLSMDGVHITAIDDYELSRLGLVLYEMFGESGTLGLLVVENKPSGRTNDMFLATCHEYYIFNSLNPQSVLINFFPLKEEERTKYSQVDEISAHKWRDFLRTGGYSTPEERPNSYYPIYLNPDTGELGLERREGAIEILPIDSSGRKRVWRKTKPSFLRHLADGEIRATKTREGKYKIEIIDRIKFGTRPKSIWVGARYDAATHGTKLLKDVLGESSRFDFPKSVYAVRDAIWCSTDPDENHRVLDYFAGSGTTGHAVINLNREDASTGSAQVAGRRKFILVEMAHYFDTVLLPRIKKVTFTPEWKDGKPKRMATAEEAERSPRLVKVIRLESYEDALNNLTFDEASGQKALELFKDDYLLHYMLRWETRHSETLLDVEKLQSPFAYKLRIHRDGETRERLVDLPETFNYLLGLEVQTRKVYDDVGQRYLVYRGALRNEHNVAIVWRGTQGWTKEDYERDRDFVAEQKLTVGADEVFVNGDSLIPGARSLDPIFKERMFAGAVDQGGHHLGEPASRLSKTGGGESNGM